jgi:type II secretory pathway pseudopilin PulG
VLTLLVVFELIIGLALIGVAIAIGLQMRAVELNTEALQYNSMVLERLSDAALKQRQAWPLVKPAFPGVPGNIALAAESNGKTVAG